MDPGECVIAFYWTLPPLSLPCSSPACSPCLLPLPAPPAACSSLCSFLHSTLNFIDGLASRAPTNIMQKLNLIRALTSTCDSHPRTHLHMRFSSAHSPSHAILVHASFVIHAFTHPPCTPRQLYREDGHYQRALQSNRFALARLATLLTVVQLFFTRRDGRVPGKS